MAMQLRVLFGLSLALACVRQSGELQAVPETFALEQVPGAPTPEVTFTVVDPLLWNDASTDGPVRDVVYTEPGELPRLLVSGAPLPLRHTGVRAYLRGEVAEVVVTQRFVNDHTTPLEAIYSFPLPENSAVTDMRMKIGDRVITAEIQGREEAATIYHNARKAGRTAALLEQERPNVFTQSVANIAPGAAVEVELRYLQTISYDAGEYEFVFPTVVGPRYLPGVPLARPGTGAGTVADTDRVPDASRISPPVIGRGMRSGQDLTIEVTAEAGAPITAWTAPAHAITAVSAGARLHVTLARRDEIPNRDFVLRYRSAGARPSARLFLGPGSGADGGHFMLVVDPPRLDVDAIVGRRELIFVVDVSGSMTGGPLALAQATMQAALARVRPVDTFNVLVFAGATGRLFAAPRPASTTNIARALEYVDGLYAGGGTEIGKAVEVALEGEVAAGRDRHVFFLTDGYISDEDAIARGTHVLLTHQAAAGRRARIFGVGIGAATNNHLIDTMSRAGHGAPLYIRHPVDVAAAAWTFERLTAAPVLTDVAIDWHGLTVSDLSPGTALDLLASRPLVVLGRYHGTPPTALTLRARVGARSFAFPIAVTSLAASDAVLARLWARARIGELDLIRATAQSSHIEAAARQDIRALGLQHHLVTAYTSLVTVDSAPPRRSGAPLSVVQPVDAPQGAYATSYGVPLGGSARPATIGHESKYVVDGANATSPAFGTVSSTIVQEFIGPPDKLLQRGPEVEPHAHARLRRVTAGAAATKALRALVPAQLPAVGACFTVGPRASYRFHQALTLVVRLGEHGDFPIFGIRSVHPLDPDLATCIRRRLESTLRTALQPGATAQFELRIRMQF